MSGDAKLSPERARELARTLAAYERLMDEIVPESQYWQGKRQDDDKVAYLSGIIER